MRSRHRLGAFICTALCLSGCGKGTQDVRRANPASQNCVATGGKHITEATSAGEMGICLFEDNRQCEEWALLRGHCPTGGLHVAGYTTDEERHCAIRGGQMVEAACSLPTEGASP